MSKIPFRVAYGEKYRCDVENTEPSMTKQSFRDECDINVIMKKWEKTGVIDHVRDIQGQYGDFTDVKDYRSALDAVIQAQEAFDGFPAELRARFSNDPAQFLDFVQDPSNMEEMISLGLAEAPKVNQESTQTLASTDAKSSE